MHKGLKEINVSEDLSRKRIQKGEKPLVTEENARASNLEKGDKENKNRCQQEDFEVKGRPMFVCLSHDGVPITARN